MDQGRTSAETTATLPGETGAGGGVGVDASAMSAARVHGAALVDASKVGITRLVTITALVGLAMAGAERSWGVWELVATIVACAVGTALSAAGANAMNQWMEKDRDAAMHRTRRRPIPSGRVSAGFIAWSGAGLIVAGCVVLWVMCGVVPAVVSLACAVSYLAVYTPLKPVTTMATYVGAIPGALPPLIGWTAAAGGGVIGSWGASGGVSGAEGAGGGLAQQWASLGDAGGLVLFAIMFAWQIPHFQAIAWMHREDYAKGGYRVLSVLDATGSTTAAVVTLWTIALVALTLAPAWAMPESVGMAYVVVAAVSGLGFAWFALRLAVARTRGAARGVFFASIVHLPLVFGAMVVEALVRAVVR
jgi:protoheme IX farnesyltransferase